MCMFTALLYLISYNLVYGRDVALILLYWSFSVVTLDKSVCQVSKCLCQGHI